MAIVFGSKALGDFPTVIRAGGTSDAFVRPFDIEILPSNQFSVAAGTVNNFLPSNMFDNFAYTPGTNNFCVLNVTTSAGGVVTSASISVSLSPPSPPNVLQGGPPTSLNLLFGIINDDGEHRTIGDSNFTITIVEAYKIPKSVSVGELPYDIYYTWDIKTS